MDLLWLPGARFWTSIGFRELVFGLVFGPPLASGVSFLDLLWFAGARFWTRFWTSSGFRGLVFRPPLVCGGSFLDLIWLPGARFRNCSGFWGLVFGPPLVVFGPPLPSGFLDLLWLPDSPDSRFTGLAFPLTCSLAFVFPRPPKFSGAMLNFGGVL